MIKTGKISNARQDTLLYVFCLFFYLRRIVSANLFCPMNGDQDEEGILGFGFWVSLISSFHITFGRSFYGGSVDVIMVANEPERRCVCFVGTGGTTPIYWGRVHVCFLQGTNNGFSCVGVVVTSGIGLHFCVSSRGKKMLWIALYILSPHARCSRLLLTGALQRN